MRRYIRHLGRCEVLNRETVRKGKELLVRIVAMLTRMIEREKQVRENEFEYVYEYGNENGLQSGKPDGINDSQ